jgi:protein EFR3
MHSLGRMCLIIACLSCQIAKFLEQRSHKELRASHVNFIGVITEAYSKLLFICKEQM